MHSNRIINIHRVLLFSWILVSLFYGCSNSSINPGNIPSDNPIINACFDKNVDFNNANSIWEKECGNTNTKVYECLEGGGYNKSNCIFFEKLTKFSGEDVSQS
ncbi:MAG: hypothetical protein JXB49_24165 [Bacteroidales bacterium]|nr:hypothetical protein [Bacteroidales bacterium]